MSDKATCFRCETLQPKASLNLEGAIHHRTAKHCLDQKGCRRRARKLRLRKAVLKQIDREVEARMRSEVERAQFRRKLSF